MEECGKPVTPKTQCFQQPVATPLATIEARQQVSRDNETRDNQKQVNAETAIKVSIDSIETGTAPLEQMIPHKLDNNCQHGKRPENLQVIDFLG